MAAPEEPPPAFVHALRPAHGPGTVLLVVGGRIARGDAAPLGDQVRALLDGCGATLAICDLGMIDQPGAPTIDLLCRIRLLARRLGVRLEFRAAAPELSDVLFLTGLSGLILVQDPSGVDPQR